MPRQIIKKLSPKFAVGHQLLKKIFNKKLSPKFAVGHSLAIKPSVPHSVTLSLSLFPQIISSFFVSI